MERVTGIGGIFFKTKDPQALQAWYTERLGVPVHADGAVVFEWDAMLAQLRAAGVTVDDKIEESEYGRFGWALDPDGNRIELWEPPGAR
jgi:catechol 2,3-dioxygenase-like lactoylglutathione lyase family enzyme